MALRQTREPFVLEELTMLQIAITCLGKRVNVSVTVDPDKVKADTDAVKEKAMELTGQATQGAKELVNPSTDELKSDEKWFHTSRWLVKRHRYPIFAFSPFF